MAKHILYLDNGTQKQLPTKWVICGECNGNGRHSGHLGAICGDEMREMGPDFMEDYMAGNFDIACTSCDGSGKVTVVDRDAILPADRAAFLQQERDERDMYYEEAMERRMGA